MTIEELNKIEAAAWDAVKAAEELCYQALSIWAATVVAFGEAAETQNAANDNKAAAGPKLSIVEKV